MQFDMPGPRHTSRPSDPAVMAALFAEAEEPTGPVDPALLMPDGVVVQPPAAEADPDNPRAVTFVPNAVGAGAAIGYGQLDTPRVTPAFRQLHGQLCQFIALEPDWFVLLAGDADGNGSVAMFGEVRELGDRSGDFRLYRVVSYDPDSRRFTHASRIDRGQADALFAQRRKELA